jgi:multiple antibiotic resistance protein
MNNLLVNALYLLVLINPISKISILALFSTHEDRRQMNSVVVRSSLIAFIILILMALAGDVLFSSVFHIDMYALRATGGLILATTGYTALKKGVFFEVDIHNKFSDLSIVPLASPLIAGPATITAVVSYKSIITPLQTLGAIALAIICNMLMMLSAPWIGAVLTRFNILGALIRITGLIVMAMGVQMSMEGVQQWLLVVEAAE